MLADFGDSMQGLGVASKERSSGAKCDQHGHTQEGYMQVRMWLQESHTFQ